MNDKTHFFDCEFGQGAWKGVEGKQIANISSVSSFKEWFACILYSNGEAVSRISSSNHMTYVEMQN